MAKNFSKEELETDVLVTGYAKAIAFYKDHTLKIYLAIAAVILVVGGGLAYYLITERNEAQSQEMLAFAERYFEAGEYELALFGNPDAGHAGLVDISNQFRRTSAGNIASYYAAVAEVRMGNYQEALIYIERFNPPSGILGVGPVSLHASILGSLSQYEEAARMFERAANWDVNESTTPQNLLNAAQAYYEAGNYAKAKELSQTIVKDFPDSPAVQSAKNLKGMLAVR